MRIYKYCVISTVQMCQESNIPKGGGSTKKNRTHSHQITHPRLGRLRAERTQLWKPKVSSWPSIPGNNLGGIPPFQKKQEEFKAELSLE
jgi:hypothetical protein